MLRVTQNSQDRMPPGVLYHTLPFPAVRLGMILPVVVPLILLTIGALRKVPKIRNTAFAMAVTLW